MLDHWLLLQHLCLVHPTHAPAACACCCFARVNPQNERGRGGGEAAGGQSDSTYFVITSQLGSALISFSIGECSKNGLPRQPHSKHRHACAHKYMPLAVLEPWM